METNVIAHASLPLACLQQQLFSKHRQCPRKRHPWVHWDGDKKERVVQLYKDVGCRHTRLKLYLGPSCPLRSTLRGWMTNKVAGMMCAVLV